MMKWFGQINAYAGINIYRQDHERISKLSEIDYRRQHGVHASEKRFICGQDQPDDWPEHTY